MNPLTDFKAQIKLVAAPPDVVKAVQTELNRVGFPLVVDGLAGIHTVASFEQFKKEHFLSNPDLLGPSSAEALLTTEVSKFLTEPDYKRASLQLGIEEALIKAVVKVETAGHGFLPDGRPKILFERHWFYHFTAGQYVSLRPDICNADSGGYIGGAREWDRLTAAMHFNKTAALKSASWGLGQIMGFNSGSSGYGDVEVFVSAMQVSEGKQLLAMMNFIKNERGIYNALMGKDWANFARLYNGPRYKANNYDVNLANAYRSFVS